MQTESIVLTLTALAAAALTKKRFVDYAGAPAAAGVATLGVANADYAQGEQAGVDAQGSILVEAGAAVAVGAVVEADAQGRAITQTTGVAAGRARDAAAAAGDLIRIVR